MTTPLTVKRTGRPTTNTKTMIAAPLTVTGLDLRRAFVARQREHVGPRPATIADLLDPLPTRCCRRRCSSLSQVAAGRELLGETH